MKKLKIYIEKDEYVIERVNEFNHATKRYYITENGLFEGLDSYKKVMDEYEIEVTKELWSKVIKYLQKEEC